MIGVRAALPRRAALAGAAMLLAGAGRPTVLAATPIARLDLPWWRERHEAVLARLRQGKVELLWLGDSITQDWERPEFRPVWDRFYGGRSAVNLGFVGDTTANLLWRVGNGELEDITPRAAVVLIGANNFGHVHWPAADTVAGIGAILDTLSRRLPIMQVLLLGILPCDRGPWVAEQTIVANGALAARFGATGSRVKFLDLTHLFVHDGALDHDLFLDPLKTPPRPALHPTAQGQHRIAEAIEPTLAAMLGDARRG